MTSLFVRRICPSKGRLFYILFDYEFRHHSKARERGLGRPDRTFSEARSE
jgi:hypothetical protein